MDTKAGEETSDVRSTEHDPGKRKRTRDMTEGDWRQWQEENKEAIANYNARIAREGLPLAKYRRF